MATTKPGPAVVGGTKPWQSKDKAQAPKDTGVSQDAFGRFHGPNVCRMCGTQFSNSDELKKHIRVEGHFDTPAAVGGQKPAYDMSHPMQKQPADDHRQKHVSFPKKVDSFMVHPEDEGFSSNKFLPHHVDTHALVRKEYPRASSSSNLSRMPKIPLGSKTEEMASNGRSSVEESVEERERNLREILRSKLSKKVNATPVSASIVEAKKSPRREASPILDMTKDRAPHPSTSPHPLDFDRGRRSDVSGTVLFSVNIRA
jgi:hypothetical protein